MKDTAILNAPIASSTDLRHHIMKLNALREEQEMALKRDVKELYYSLQLSTMIKRTVKDLTSDPEIKSSALQTSIDIGSSFLLDKLLFRKGAGIKSYLLNMGLKKLISIFNSGDKLSNLFTKKHD